MSALTTLLLLGSVFATSVLSGVIGMAGGMILMALLVLLLPVGAAMVLHGAVQGTANGARAWFLRRHVQWRILPPYLAGAALALAAFVALTLVPDAGLVLILVGLFPWLARLTPQLRGLDVTRPLTALSCGAVVTAAQLLAGASGPLLDVFYLDSRLSRYAVVATKALTQTLGHLLKLFYYGVLVAGPEQPALWLVLTAMTMAVAGTRLGTRLLDRLDEGRFRRVSSAVILAIATLCLADGLRRVLLG